MGTFFFFGKLWDRLFLRRNVVALLTFFGFFNLLIIRASLSVAIVAMTQNRSVTTEQGDVEYVQDFNWTSTDKGYILGSFFYGYICTQLIGGWLGTKFGGARLYGVGTVVTGLFNLVIPLAAYLGIGYLVIVRIIEGLFEGITFPCIHAMWGKWAPIQERTQLATFGFSGAYFGIVVAFPMCGFLVKRFGWASIFYSTGIATFLWYILWFIFVKEDPAMDPWISEEELKYIKGSISSSKNQKIIHPWKSYFTSMPVWAIVAAHFSEACGFYTMLTQLPSYLNDTLQFDIQAIGFLSALPYLLMCILLPVGGIIADKLIQSSTFSTTQVRKLFNCCGATAQSILLTCSIFVDSVFAVLVLITLTIGLSGFVWSAFAVNHLDLAPRQAGILMGISNTFATIAGFLVPNLAGHIVQNKTKAEWRIVFCIAGVTYLLGAIFYGLFASGERQPWAASDEPNDDPNVKNNEKCATIGSKGTKTNV